MEKNWLKKDLYKINLFNNNKKVKFKSIINKVLLFFLIFLNIFIIIITIKQKNYFIKMMVLNLKETKKTNDFQIKLLKNILDIIYDKKNNQNNIIEYYIEQQKDFCDNPKKYFNKFIEKQIILKNAIFNESSFKFYMFKKKTLMNFDLKNGVYEYEISSNIIEALLYFSKKKNITNKKDIIMIDIGGNIGWYSSLLGKLGYSVLSFEPLEMNYYVSRKNYCNINNNSNVIIINKGLGNEDMTCDYYKDITLFSNGMVICNKSKIENKNIGKRFKKSNDIKLTRLSNFIPYLKNKNIALIKLDVEGAEGKAIESGIELITKYHVPFIEMEFTPSFLLEHGTNPLNFLKLLVNNGYKISLNGFLKKEYITEEYLMKIVGHHTICYFINKEIIDESTEI